MAYKVGFLDSDGAYQKALMEYLNLRATIPIQLFVFSEPEALQKFLETTSLELLLLGDDFSDLTVPGRSLILTGQREYQDLEGYVFRYQSVDKIVNILLEIIRDGQKERISECVCFAVYSPLGRCGKTAFAKSLWHRLSNSLYVNWEGVSSEQGDAEFGSRVLYSIKSRNEEEILRLQEMSIVHLPSPVSFQDIRQVEAEDIEWFRQVLQKHSLYHGIVFDIGGTSLSGFSILGAFDRIFVPTLADSVSAAKLAAFERMLVREAGEEIKRRLQYVELEHQDADAVAATYIMQ